MSKQLTIFDINNKDEIEQGKWNILCKLHKAHNANKISDEIYGLIKERIDYE